MASSVWSALEGAGGGSGSGGTSSYFGIGHDPAALLNSQLASALTMTGDAQYWEETISPATIRQSLQDANPSDASQTKTLLRAMKWLLAAISKGRNVSDFYPHVVKLVGHGFGNTTSTAVSLEVRKMVYMYLVQYADHDDTTRELSLLSINSFQRGLADSEPLIRALALRVLTSIRLNDILQIQMLGVQKCSKDRSPYVRKCAANALAKLYPRCSSSSSRSSSNSQQQQQQHQPNQQQSLLLDILVHLLETDQATMVLTSCLVSLQEVCPHRLDFIHGSFHKICHLLTDMDEWGQVVVIDLLARYVRTYFAEPVAWRHGTAERIDQQRRVRRTIHGTIEINTSSTTSTRRSTSHTTANNDFSASSSFTMASSAAAASASAAAPSHLLGPLNNGAAAASAAGASSTGVGTAFRDHSTTTRGGGSGASRQKVKRRVVKKGFYSDEEDESTEEEVYVSDIAAGAGASSAKRNVLGLPPSTATSRVLAAAAVAVSNGGDIGHINNGHNPHNDDEDVELAADHRLILNSAMPLLKSRNAGVVLAVCSLLYYCGVSSVQVRSSMGKALVRIFRGGDDVGREIQYVVLSSIRTLVTECPSALSPFLHDFYVNSAMDPPFTRFIKLDILTALALDPTSIRNVLNELRLYVRATDDLAFAMAAIRAVGRVVELARIVHDRHGQKQSSNSNSNKKNQNSGLQERAEANQVALNALHGLLTLTQLSPDSSGSRWAVGQGVIVMQQILQLLQSDAGDHGDLMNVHDSNKVQYKCIKRIMLLLLHTLSSCRSAHEDETENDNSNDDGGDEENHEEQVASALEKVATVDLPPSATASALWLVGELLTCISPNTIMFGTKLDAKQQCRIRLELVRLLVKSFPQLHAVEKEQAIRFTSKMLVSKAAAATTAGMSSMSFLPEEGPLCEQLLAIGRVDVNPQVRDGARSDSGILRLTIGIQCDADALDDISPLLVGEKALTLEHVQKMLLQGKPASSSLPVEDYTNTHDTESKGFRFGTLSSIVGHRARSAYVPLPPWADKDTPSELRTPAADRKSKQNNDSNAAATAAGGGDGWTTKNQSGAPTGAGGLYDDSSSNDDDDSSSSSSSSSSSGDNDYGNDSSSSDSSSSEASNVDADIESSESSDDEDDSSSSGEEETRPTSMPPSQTIGGRLSNKVDDVSRMDSSDGSDDDSSSVEGAASSRNLGSLIPMTNQTSTTAATPAVAAAVVKPASGSLADDFKGMVLAPVVVANADETQQDPNMSRDSSAWFPLVRPEHAGGLAVSARYIRGLTKAREAQLMGLTADKASLVCLQIRFENKKANAAAGGSSSFRHLRVVQRSSSTSGSMIGPRKVVLPQEIDVLHVGQRSDCMLGIEFTSPSDRDGSLLAKFDIKFGSGGIPVEIKPVIADVLLPCVRSQEEFDEQIKRLQGFQRVDTNLSIDSSKLDQLPGVVLQCAALTPVGQSKLGFQEDKLRLAGTLPASSNPVYVLVCTLAGGKYKLSICSDDAMAANSVMNVLKRNIQERLK